MDELQEQLKQLERSLELRERAVASREAAAEKRLAEATEAAAEAQVAARQDAEREYMELKASLTQQRMQLEVEPRGRAVHRPACTSLPVVSLTSCLHLSLFLAV